MAFAVLKLVLSCEEQGDNKLKFKIVNQNKFMVSINLFCGR